ncbi:MAG: tetratricopeptide repeat protein [Candidatus Marinimicrobia bacterium]|jgi:TolA-binding protein|nr:tetratricopeptide repeat protein [Candidatus Neomarinimicrobiota bacterium]|tara:strand:- start:699 stop:1583 length:885 start_codon:yes stop_codon:yes gene_type:complete
MDSGALTNRIQPLIKGLITLILIGLLSAQETPPLSEIFFLDLGIVIEPSKGSGYYSRLVEKPSEEVSFKINKVESGSVFMASSKELLSTLDRINKRIARLESSFQTEMNALKQENISLRNTLTEIQSSDNKKADSPAENFVTKPMNKSKPFVEMPQKLLPSQKVPEPASVFNHSIYMSGVFAYQRDDFESALDKFSNLHLDSAPKKTVENIFYWMADAYQQTGQFEKALSLLDKITTTGTLRIDDALVQKGLLHRRMGNENLAMIAFGDVVSQHPNSEYIRLAQMELKKSDTKK